MSFLSLFFLSSFFLLLSFFFLFLSSSFFLCLQTESVVSPREHRSLTVKTPTRTCACGNRVGLASVRGDWAVELHRHPER
jgi:hypothetical protein